MRLIAEKQPERINRGVMSVMFVTIVMLMFAAFAIPNGKFVLVVMEPGSRPSDLMDTVTKAGGTFVDSTRFDWMAIAYSDQDGFSTRLRSAGAMMVINHLLVAGCKGRAQT